MALTDTAIRALKPREKAFKVADEKGLYLQITPAGGKLWRFKYRFGDAEKKLAFGTYPEISLAQAREARENARKQIASGDDPAAIKQRDKVAAKIQAGNTFASVAEEFIATRMEALGKAPNTVKKARWFLKLLTPALGKRPIADIQPHELLAVLKRMEADGRHETSNKCLAFASRAFRYGVATTRCDTDPAALLRGALITPTVKHFAAVLDPVEFGGVLRAIDGYTGNPVTRSALQIGPHVFVRPGELRQAMWNEIDLENAIWRIPAEKMKLRRPHAVPLSRQVIAFLESLSVLTGRDGYVFPSIRTPTKPMSENTVNAGFRRMGYTGDEITAHGLRATASTFLNESGKWNSDAIERALAHGDSDAVRGSYNRGTYWPERVEMAQWWSDYLDRLRAGGEIVPFPAQKQA
jgi:integrase